MRGYVAKVGLWCLMSAVVVPALIALAESVPNANSYAQRGESWWGGLLFVGALQAQWAIPRVAAVVIPVLLVFAVITAFLPRLDSWLTVLVLLPACCCGVAWLIWVLTSEFWLTHSNMPYAYVSLSAVLPRVAPAPLWPGRLFSARSATAA